MKSIELRLLRSVGLASALALTASLVASAHELTPGSKGSFTAGGNVAYRFVGISPGSALGNTVDTALEVNFHNPNWNNSRIPTLSYSSSGTARVLYIDDTTSPCTG